MRYCFYGCGGVCSHRTNIQGYTITKQRWIKLWKWVLMGTLQKMSKLRFSYKDIIENRKIWYPQELLRIVKYRRLSEFVFDYLKERIINLPASNSKEKQKGNPLLLQWGWKMRNIRSMETAMLAVNGCGPAAAFSYMIYINSLTRISKATPYQVAQYARTK